MEFTYNQKREKWASAQRSVAVGTKGMACSSQSLATSTGMRVLQKGGNAIDAAVAMVGTLSVVEPHSVGIGGDAFALILPAGGQTPVGINGSGRSPYKASIDWFAAQGIKEVPEKGILAVTVPGALHAWQQMLDRYGTMPLSEALADAIRYADEGFPVTEVISGEWKHMEPELRSDVSAARTFLVNGSAPAPGNRFRNPDLARTLKKIARDGIDAFYHGEVRDAILRCSQRLGGLLSEKDFADHTTTWVKPISTTYRGYEVYQLPPNGQGLSVLEILNILEGYNIAALGHNSVDYIHLFVEAKKAAFSDRDAYITDPEFEDIPLARLMSKDYAGAVRDNIGADRAKMPPLPIAHSSASDTVYVTAVDSQRNAVSLISSIFHHFGSGVVVDDTGIVLQNRGRSFSLDPRRMNRLAPHKRPMHTIIPSMVFRNGRFIMSFGVVGADMQPQGQVQFLTNLIDFKMNMQEAMDAPRARHIDGMDIYLEDGISDETRSALQARGHKVMEGSPASNQAGGGQAIYFDEKQDLLLGASDRRKDGCAAGY